MSQKKSKIYSNSKLSDDERDSDLNVDYTLTLASKQYIKKAKPKGSVSLMIKPWFIWFTFCLLAAILFIPFWFYNNEIMFDICGGFTLTVLLFAVYKFYILIGNKHLLHKIKDLDHAYLKEIIKLKAQIDRTRNAMNILKDTKKRITKSNAINRNNVKLFKDIETKIKNAGIEQNTSNKASQFRNEWKTEYINNEKDTLTSIYNRFIEEKSDNHKNNLETLTRQQFHEFQYNFLPIIYRVILAKVNVFDELDTYNDGVINVETLGKYLDKIAENIDIVNDTGNTFEDIENDEHKSMPKYSESKLESKSNNDVNPPRKESLFADDYDILDDKNVNKTADIQPQQQRKGSLFADDYDILDDKKQKRKIGKLKHKWGDTQSKDSGGKYTPKSKVINADESWVKQKSVTVHPVHDSIDALGVSKLVSKSVQNFFPNSPICEEKEKDGKDKVKKKKVTKLKSGSNCESSEDDMDGTFVKKKSFDDQSWIKHKSPELKHVPHESVVQLQLKGLASFQNVQLGTVGENIENTPIRTDKENDKDPFDM